MDIKHIGYRKRRFKPFFNLRTWWKSRRFQYLIHVNAPEESVAKECRRRTDKDSEYGSAATSDTNRPLAHYLETNNTTEISELLLKSPAVNSFHDSIDSLDSVVNSQCTDSEENIPETAGSVDKFLMEHLDFLSQSTSAQEVELVYDTG